MSKSLPACILTLRGLQDTVFGLEQVADLAVDIRHANRRGYFTPGEDERLWAWFSRLLRVRQGLWEIIGQASEAVGDDLATIQTRIEWRWFIIGFTAAALLVRLDRLLVESLANHSITQRKLNEPNPVYGVGRKQYTLVFQSLTSPENALLARSALGFYTANHSRLQRMMKDELVGDFVQELPELARVIDPSVLRYLSTRLRYRWHSLRRRGASARQKSAFRLLEAGGRMVAEASSSRMHRVAAVMEEIAALILPGDILITRHDFAISNLFLPGFWPHAALYIGSQRDRECLGVHISPAQRERWRGDRNVLEANKEGVLFRALKDTLAVDSVAVIRPCCEEKDIAKAISRACVHEGKGYNFDFDFFRGDRLVCTEVIYRAYDGVGGIRFTLTERAGRPALSAEDILDLALEGRMFRLLALFGVAGCEDRLCRGEEAGKLLPRNLRSS